MAQETNTSLDTDDLDKTEELDTADLVKPSEEITDDIDTKPVRKRLDSSQWITSW